MAMTNQIEPHNRPTPEHWPIYGVYLSETQICDLVNQVFPNSQLAAHQELEQGNSFNNRIYFADIAHPQTETDLDTKDYPDKVALKIIGRYFDARKVRNEVACLLLLEKYCPNVPAPRIIAWSEDGTSVSTVRNGVFAVTSNGTLVEGAEDMGSPYGWVMQTKMPGRILSQADLNGPHAHELAQQIAEMMAEWRKNIEPRDTFGNIDLKVAGYTSSHDLHGLETFVAGLPLCETQPVDTLNSSLEFYNHLLADQLFKLKTNNHFDSLRTRTLVRLENFKDKILPRLPCFNAGNENVRNTPVFGHADFAPRNFLISDLETLSSGSAESKATISPSPRISGVLDFEFAGYLPANHDFITSEHEWACAFWQDFLHRLREQGVDVPLPKTATPSLSPGVELYRQEKSVAQLIDQVAPWWLQNGHDELEHECEKAAKLTEDFLDQLESAIG